MIWIFSGFSSFRILENGLIGIWESNCHVCSIKWEGICYKFSQDRRMIVGMSLRSRKPNKYQKIEGCKFLALTPHTAYSVRYPRLE